MRDPKERPARQEADMLELLFRERRRQSEPSRRGKVDRKKPRQSSAGSAATTPHKKTK